MNRAASLHFEWARAKPEGAMSKECQELNALYSQCVDGTKVTIPQRLQVLPEPLGQFIVDIMFQEAKQFAQQWLTSDTSVATNLDRTTDEQSVLALLSSNRVSMSEFQALQLAGKIARRSSIDFREYYPMINFSALGVTEKHTVCQMFKMNDDERRMVWNR
jgi:hypothetical protein